MTSPSTRSPNLQTGQLLEVARQATGLSDFGPPGFRVGLERLIEAVNRLQLTELGVQRTQASIVGSLTARLGVWDHRLRHPEVAAEEIRSPVFVTGVPRSGTTLLFGLLAQDADHRVPMLWETAAPCPPPEEATYDSDPRIAMVTSHLHTIDGLNPKVLAVHPIAAQLPQECIGIFAMHFMSYLYYCGLPIRSYNDWLDEQDQTDTYHWHRIVLQHLQSRHRKPRWALKAPSHMEFMAPLFATYPDALVISMHRSPVEVVTSHASLHWHLWEQSLGHVDSRAVGPEVADMLERWLRRFVDWRERNPERARQIVDVVYDELVARPVATVRSIYERFGLQVSPAFEGRMLAFLEEHRQDRHGRHRYEPADFGLAPAALAGRFSFYTDRYEVIARRR